MSKYQSVPHSPLHLYVSEPLHWRKYSATKNVFYFQKTVVAAVCSLSAWRNWRQLRKSVSTIWLRERDLEREGGDSRQCTRHTNSDTGEAGKVKTRTHATSQHIHITHNTQQTQGHEQKVSPLSWHSQSYLRRGVTSTSHQSVVSQRDNCMNFLSESEQITGEPWTLLPTCEARGHQRTRRYLDI